MARSKVSFRKNAIAKLTKDELSRPNCHTDNKVSLRTMVRIVDGVKAARDRAFAAHGLDKSSPIDKEWLFNAMALALYGGRGAGRPRQNNADVIAGDINIADEVDRLVQMHGLTRAEACDRMKSMHLAYAHVGSKTIQRRDRRGRSYRK